MSEKTLTLRRAVLAAVVASYGGVPANFTSGNLVKIAPSPDPISGFRMQARLATSIDLTTRVDVNPRVGTVGATEVAAQNKQIRADSSAVANAQDAQVINDVPKVAQDPLFCAMLQNGVQPRSETSTSTIGDR
jgi:hypothetical protein